MPLPCCYLQVRAADNRIIQEQLNQKIGECEELRETFVSLKQQLAEAQEQRDPNPLSVASQHQLETKTLHKELLNVKESSALKYAKQKLLLQAQEAEIEELKRKMAEVSELNQKLAEDSYAKGVASAAAVELKALS